MQIVAFSHAFQATKSRGLLKPPLRFMYCLYLRLRMTCTAPGSFSVTCFPLVVSNAQNPIVRIISISSTLFPSRSFSAQKQSAAVLAIQRSKIVYLKPEVFPHSCYPVCYCEGANGYPVYGGAPCPEICRATSTALFPETSICPAL
jgi:hypothetical protein